MSQEPVSQQPYGAGAEPPPSGGPTEGAPTEEPAGSADEVDLSDSEPSAAADAAAAGAGTPEGEVPEGDVTSELFRQLDERTADLQRLQAEYVNYKRRVDRDRHVVRDTAIATVLTGLLGVLDDLDRARLHGELTGGFKAVADSLERTLTGLGLERFGEPGEPFDPRVHEALMHSHADDVDGPTAQAILQPGYRVADRVLRPARVAVVEPAPAAAPAEPGADEVEDAGGRGGSADTG